MNIRRIYGIAVGMVFLLCQLQVQAQSPGSLTTYGGNSGFTFKVATGVLQHDRSESIYIGSGTYTIDGTWEIYSKNVFIDPAAVITGGGVIKIYNAMDVGGAGGVTYMDGNNSEASTHPQSAPIETSVELHNASGMKLVEIELPSALTSRGFINLNRSSMYIGKDIKLMLDGANIILGTTSIGDLRMDNDATITNYSVNRMVVTTDDAVTSHVVKDAGASSFFYPIGISAGDYTPVRIVGNGKYYVGVQSVETIMSPSVPTIHEPEEGMYRVWHIYQGNETATTSSVTLHHNTTTNGSSYNDVAAFIARYEGGGMWGESTLPDYDSPGVHSNESGIPGGIPTNSDDNGAFLTKTSEETSPLPINLLSFDAVKKGMLSHIKWETSAKINNFGFNVERSKDGHNWQSIGFIPTQSTNGSNKDILRYEFYDGQPLVGINYYRLKSMSEDGEEEWSDVVAIQFDIENNIAVYPVPTDGEYVYVSGVLSDSYITIFDTTGKIVFSSSFSNQEVAKINISQFESGVYLLLVSQNEGRSQFFKIIKV